MAHVRVVAPGGEVEEYLVEEEEGVNVKDEMYAGADQCGEASMTMGTIVIGGCL